VAKKRASLEGEDETFMTFDRLTPDPFADEYPCVRVDRSGPSTNAAHLGTGRLRG
jgi:hypothetical protein